MKQKDLLFQLDQIEVLAEILILEPLISTIIRRLIVEGFLNLLTLLCKHSVIFEEIFNQKSEKCLWTEQFKGYHNFIELTRNMVVTLIERILIYKDKSINIKYRYQDNYDSAVYFIHTVKEISE